MPSNNAMVLIYLVKISRSTFLNQSLKRMAKILDKGILKLASSVINRVTFLVNAQMLIAIIIADLQEEKTIICQETIQMSTIPKNLLAKTSSTILFLVKLNTYLDREEAERTISVEMKWIVKVQKLRRKPQTWKIPQ